MQFFEQMLGGVGGELTCLMKFSDDETLLKNKEKSLERR